MTDATASNVIAALFWMAAGLFLVWLWLTKT